MFGVNHAPLTNNQTHKEPFFLKKKPNSFQCEKTRTNKRPGPNRAGTETGYYCPGRKKKGSNQVGVGRALMFWEVFHFSVLCNSKNYTDAVE